MKFRRLARRREKKERWEVGFSFLVSLLVHLLLLLVAALAVLWQERTSSPPPPPPAPLTVTILPPPPPEPPRQTFLDTANMLAAEQPPVDARFESDRDTQAAAEVPDQGSTDLPSLDGREENYIELVNQESTLGEIPQPSTPSTPSNSSNPSTPSQPPAKQEASPEATPSPSPTATPSPTPDALPLSRPTPPPVRRAEPIAPDAVRQEVRRAESAQPAPPARPGFQPERRITRIEGGVSNRGPTSAAAQATPLGRYKKALSDAVGSRWYFYVRNEIGLLAVGTATIRFQVLADGRVTGVRVLTNSSNESFAAVSIRSILEAEIPPIPPEVVELLEGERIEVDYTFSILAN